MKYDKIKPMFLNSLRVGFFLAVRYITRSSVWSTVLIVFVMLLTFLNVIVVRGILVGIPEGARIAYEEEYAGQVIVSPLDERSYIERSRSIERALPTTAGYRDHTSRYIQGGVVEANYTTVRKKFELADDAAALIVGIDPSQEDRVTGIADRVAEGQYLTQDDDQEVLLGHQLLDRYLFGNITDGSTISDVFPGDKVRITLGDNTREYTVKGIVEGKVGENNRRIFMLNSELRKLINRFDQNVDEIAVRVDPSVPPERFRDDLLLAGFGGFAVIQTAVESQGQFLEDIRQTFEILSSLVGAIGVVVASITVFIVIFIFAIARQKQIGILKGIGISNVAVESSYVFLALFYATIGISLGLALLYGVIKPFLDEHPINFPFSDGVLVASLEDTLARIGIIIIATILAGYVPARMIVKKNTINAILGR